MKRRNGRLTCLLVLLMCVLLLCGSAMAEQILTIPAQTRVIEAEAFFGDASLETVIIPETVTEIGERAFAGCTGLVEAVLPTHLAVIGDDAFPPETVLRCVPGSYAEAWATAHGYRVAQREPKYYALLVGLSYADNSSLQTLKGPAQDVQAVRRMLEGMPGSPYQISVVGGLTADGILAAIGSAFANACENDVCLFYYAGHGVYSPGTGRNGALVGEDGKSVELSRLRMALDQIPAAKIVVLDSCYSGSMIGAAQAAAEAPMDLASVNAAVVSAFRAVGRSAGGGYHILTAASPSELSFEDYDKANDRWYGVFTCHLLQGSGYNEKTGMLLSFLPADANEDNAISLNEAYLYAYAGTLSQSPGQHVQAYPNNSDFTLWIR